MSLETEVNDWLENQAKHQDEYLQVARELCEHIIPIANANSDYKKHNVVKRLLAPQQIHQFYVEWEDDNHCCNINKGWRIQHNNTLGPYKGGTRFSLNLNESVLKFLALEQTFKNALTGLSLGAGKGGADIDVKNCSHHEIRRFSKAYMRSLAPYIGYDKDIPAGDINVSNREIGYMFGEQLKHSKSYTGSLSGKPILLGGSELRNQATGFGIIYFLEQMLSECGKTVKDKSVCISGAGNVALHCAYKAIELGAKVLSLSNSKGVLFIKNGLETEHVQWLLDNKQEPNALKTLSEKFVGEFIDDETPWSIDCEVAIPCATQNEIDEKQAKQIVNNTTNIMIEGANMPCTHKAEKVIADSHLLHAPGKATNAGGVVLSAFEMQQNAAMRYADKGKLDTRLRERMKRIHDVCLYESKNLKRPSVDYIAGATVSAFRKLADATISLGY